VGDQQIRFPDSLGIFLRRQEGLTGKVPGTVFGIAGLRKNIIDTLWTLLDQQIQFPQDPIHGKRLRSQGDKDLHK
jgi:hypothetical protein